MEDTMKVQGNRYINNPEMIKNKVEKKTTVPQNIISEEPANDTPTSLCRKAETTRWPLIY